jgi:hypothetical protein
MEGIFAWQTQQERRYPISVKIDGQYFSVAYRSQKKAIRAWQLQKISYSRSKTAHHPQGAGARPAITSFIVSRSVSTLRQKIYFRLVLMPREQRYS